MSASSTPVFAQVSFDMAGAALATGLSEKSLDRAIAVGDLPARWFGRKKLVLAPDLFAWVDSLPDEKP